MALKCADSQIKNVSLIAINMIWITTPIPVIAFIKVTELRVMMQQTCIVAVKMTMNTYKGTASTWCKSVSQFQVATDVYFPPS